MDNQPKTQEITDEIKVLLLNAQKDEISKATVYKYLAKKTKKAEDKATLLQIAEDELKHAQIRKKYSKQSVHVDRTFVRRYTRIVKIFGYTFGLKLMETREARVILQHEKIKAVIPEAGEIAKDEKIHEKKLLGMLDETSLHYLGSIVLGLNDALVELTGALAGFTFGFQNAQMVAFSGLITGIAAAMSMAGSEYLSTLTEKLPRVNPKKASCVTGIAYISTVILLLVPYFLCTNVYVALGVTLVIAISIIALFNFYSSVTQGHPFKKRFLQMTCISLGVAFVSFCVGWIVKQVFGIELG